MRTLKAWTASPSSRSCLQRSAAARPDAGIWFVVGSLTIPGVSTGLVLKDGSR